MSSQRTYPAFLPSLWPLDLRRQSLIEHPEQLQHQKKRPAAPGADSPTLGHAFSVLPRVRACSQAELLSASGDLYSHFLQSGNPSLGYSFSKSDQRHKNPEKSVAGLYQSEIFSLLTSICAK